MAQIPFLDLKRQYAPYLDELKQAAASVLAQCDFIGGNAVGEFEHALAAYLSVEETVGVGAATGGLFAALKCLGIGPGDEVITTAHTAIATAEAITLTGARVVFADIDPQTYLLDPEQVVRRITPRTKAVIPVHLYGHPADMTQFQQIAQQYRLACIEDCAQAIGARYQGSPVGTLGDVGVYSFFPSKNMGGFGDGGAVVARDPKLRKRIRMYCNHGREDKYLHEFEGTNSRLDTLQATLLRINLRHLEPWNQQRRQAAALYEAQLTTVPQVQRPVELADCEHVYHLYVIQVPDREALAAHLQRDGIQTGLHYPQALHTQPAYRYLEQGAGSLPVAEHACAHILSLPISPVITPAEIAYICRSIAAFFNQG
jgi:dTDP-4-amino-4,6-dideoxygalactose transaminase